MSMHVSLLEWIVTLCVTIAVLLFDVFVMGRRSGEPKISRSAMALSAYIALAGCFGIWTWFFHGRQFAIQFFAGWLTEYSLSVDNLFIFVIIMASFGVPRVHQQRSPAGRHHDRAGLPRHLHRARRRGHQRVHLGSTSSARSWCTPRCDWRVVRPDRRGRRRTRWSGCPQPHELTDSGTAASSVVKERPGGWTPMFSSSWPWAPPTCSSPWTPSPRSTA
jgi:hypothetical protein